MTTRERRPIDSEIPSAPPAAPAEAPNAGDQSRDAGDAYLRAAEAAMARALSGTPEAFLRQNRQLGGQ